MWNIGRPLLLFAWERKGSQSKKHRQAPQPASLKHWKAPLPACLTPPSKFPWLRPLSKTLQAPYYYYSDLFFFFFLFSRFRTDFRHFSAPAILRKTQQKIHQNDRLDRTKCGMTFGSDLTNGIPTIPKNVVFKRHRQWMGFGREPAKTQPCLHVYCSAILCRRETIQTGKDSR